MQLSRCTPSDAGPKVPGRCSPAGAPPMQPGRCTPADAGPMQLFRCRIPDAAPPMQHRKRPADAASAMQPLRRGTFRPTGCGPLPFEQPPRAGSGGTAGRCRPEPRNRSATAPERRYGEPERGGDAAPSTRHRTGRNRRHAVASSRYRAVRLRDGEGGDAATRRRHATRRHGGESTQPMQDSRCTGWSRMIGPESSRATRAAARARTRHARCFVNPVRACVGASGRCVRDPSTRGARCASPRARCA